MVNAAETARAQTEISVTFDDLTVLSEGGVDVFVLDWDGGEQPPPYFVYVGERRFEFTASTLLVSGHSALLPAWVREQESEGRIPLLVERDERYYLYLHDADADAEALDEAEAEAAEDA